jgi:hypothetical protein
MIIGASFFILCSSFVEILAQFFYFSWDYQCILISTRKTKSFKWLTRGGGFWHVVYVVMNLGESARISRSYQRYTVLSSWRICIVPRLSSAANDWPRWTSPVRGVFSHRCDNDTCFIKGYTLLFFAFQMN